MFKIKMPAGLGSGEECPFELQMSTHKCAYVALPGYVWGGGSGFSEVVL
jgi:hypothetical protein